MPAIRSLIRLDFNTLDDIKALVGKESFHRDITLDELIGILCERETPNAIWRSFLKPNALVADEENEALTDAKSVFLQQPAQRLFFVPFGDNGKDYVKSHIVDQETTHYISSQHKTKLHALSYNPLWPIYLNLPSTLEKIYGDTMSIEDIREEFFAIYYAKLAPEIRAALKNDAYRTHFSEQLQQDFLPLKYMPQLTLPELNAFFACDPALKLYLQTQILSVADVLALNPAARALLLQDHNILSSTFSLEQPVALTALKDFFIKYFHAHTQSPSNKRPANAVQLALNIVQNSYDGMPATEISKVTRAIKTLNDDLAQENHQDPRVTLMIHQTLSAWHFSCFTKNADPQSLHVAITHCLHKLEYHKEDALEWQNLSKLYLADNDDISAIYALNHALLFCTDRTLAKNLGSDHQRITDSMSATEQLFAFSLTLAMIPQIIDNRYLHREIATALTDVIRDFPRNPLKDYPHLNDYSAVITQPVIQLLQQLMKNLEVSESQALWQILLKGSLLNTLFFSSQNTLIKPSELMQRLELLSITSSPSSSPSQPSVLSCSSSRSRTWSNTNTIIDIHSPTGQAVAADKVLQTALFNNSPHLYNVITRISNDPSPPGFMTTTPLRTTSNDSVTYPTRSPLTLAMPAIDPMSRFG